MTYTVRKVAVDGATHVARAEIRGDFPGSPVELPVRFAFGDHGRIESLITRT